MNKIIRLYLVALVSLCSVALLRAQEISFTTSYKTDPVKFEHFTMKIKAPKGTYYIDYGDGRGTTSHYSLGNSETISYDFADMALQAEHKVRIWGLNFEEFMILSNRKVSEITLKNCTELLSFSCANSHLKELDLSDCKKLKKVICNNNDINRLVVPESVTSIDFSRNRLSLKDFPKKKAGMTYSYGPMRPIYLATSKIQGKRVDLSELLSFTADATTRSTYKWYRFDNKGNNGDSRMLIDPNTYTEKDGIFEFNQIPEGTIYCVVENSALPSLHNINDRYGIMPIALQGESRQLETIHASFVTDKFTTAGLTFNLTLSASKAQSPCVIDWGDGVFEDVVLGVTPKEIKHHFLDAAVDKEHRVSIECKDLQLLQIPEVGGLLRFAPVTATSPVKEVVFNNNRLENIDLTTFAHCERIEANGCYIKQIILPRLAPLKKLSLRNSQIEQIDLTLFSNIEELNLSYNKLKTLNLQTLEGLKTLDITHNQIRQIAWPAQRDALTQLDCSWNAIPMYLLPEKGSLVSYKYAPQESFEITSDMIQGTTIDLSKFYQLKGVAEDPQETTFIWLHADDESKFIANGLHYDHTNGRFSFKFTEDTRIFCTMQTPAFPDLAWGKNNYRTRAITVAALGIDDIENGNKLSVVSLDGILGIAYYKDAPYTIYTTDGTIIHQGRLTAMEEKMLSLVSGIYIVVVDGKSLKVVHS